MTKAIVIDLDGTLADCSARVHLAQAKEWEAFHAGIPDDKVRDDVVCLLKMINHIGWYDVIVCTGRDEAHRFATEMWLAENGLNFYIDAILMRPNGNRESDHVLKVQMVDEYFGGREGALEKVVMVLDDRDRVVEAFRNAGFICWQVAAGAY